MWHILFCVGLASAAFSPDVSDYNAYGIKIAMNDNFLVLANNKRSSTSFFLQFSPYNRSLALSQCSIPYPNTTNMFMYTVAVGKKQTNNQTHFFFAGEFIRDASGPFIGILTYNNDTRPEYLNNNTNNVTVLCQASDYSITFKHLSNYDHQEYYILGAHPRGTHVYGFSNKFIFIFDSRNTSTIDVWNANSTWPDSTFLPHAVDVSDNFAVIAGLVRNRDTSKSQFSPVIYLLNFNSTTNRPYVVAENKTQATIGTWQDLLTYTDADLYSAQYDMSVSIDNSGNILVGMQFINRVFLFSVTQNNLTRLNPVNRHTNGRSIGNGKSIAWLDNGIAAIMINTYSLSYQWSASQVFFFDIVGSFYNSTSVPLSIFPNSHQALPQNYSSIFIHLVSSPSSLALLNDQGQLLIFNPTAAGYYPAFSNSKVLPAMTVTRMCVAGTYKNKSGVHDCSLCPSGTKNAGSSITQCVPCSSSSFCPLGSVADVSNSSLKTVSQVSAYPQSPESTIFDEILIHNMFTIGSGRCVPISPLFWALVVAAVVLVIIVVMEILKLCIKDPKSEKARNTMKRIFKHTDLIGEGEFWVGGLASFSIIVLVCFSYSFSSAYLKQYPIETTSDSYFACDLKMRNAKFDTTIQSLAITPTHEEEKMFHLLENQAFTLELDLINTQINCDSISLLALYGTTWSTIRWLNCNNTNSILSLDIQLPFQHISVQVLIEDTKTAGALQFSLSGHSESEDRYELRELHFYKTFYKNGYALARTLPISVAMTKVINETKAMVGEESNFSGIFIPTYTFDTNSLFVNDDQYVRATSAMTIINIEITETPYFVKNVQQPIARVSEVVFRNLLFTIVCLEIFGLVFLSYKLVFKPIYFCLFRRRAEKKRKQFRMGKPENGEVKTPSSVDTEFDHIDKNYISSVL